MDIIANSKHTTSNFYKKLIFSKTKDTRFLLFLEVHYTLEMDIITFNR